MATILLQIILALNLLYGKGDYTKQAQMIYSDSGYSTTTKGVVIIDTDEL